MKNIFKILFVGLIASMLWSCEKDEDLATASIVTASKLSSSKESVVLLQMQDSDEAVTFDFTPAVYDLSVVPTYTLEFAVAGTDFKSPVSIVVDDNKKTFTVNELNTLISRIGFPTDVATKLDVRINSSLATLASYSNIINVTVTLYKPNPDNVFPKIYLPGNYGTASGYTDWAEKNWGSPNLFSPKKDDVYYGFVYMNNTAPEFKFTYAEEGWANNKGDTAKPNTFTTLKKDGENIFPTNGAGTYYIKVDWNANTYAIKKMDMGIIGEATPQGWDSDVKLVFNTTTRKFETTMALQAGKPFKFRNDDSWGVKIQPSGTSDQELTSGTETMTYVSSEGTVTGDAGYTVAAAGNYKIELDLHNSANYTIKVTKQ